MQMANQCFIENSQLHSPPQNVNLNHNEVNHLNKPIISDEIETVNKNLPSEKHLEARWIHQKSLPDL